MHAITLTHNFETAHRLPQLGGKCANLHGHSWQVAVTLTAPELSADQTVVEFGEFKTHMRGWIDAYLDHGAMLSLHDPLTDILRGLGCKVFVFGEDWPHGLWPTVEATAAMIADQAREWLTDSETVVPVTVDSVRVTETATNSAERRSA